MWEAAASIETTASPAAVWALWEDPKRWPEWNKDIASVADFDQPLALGGTARVRLKGSLPMQFHITALESRRLFTDEARLPGARMGHEHHLEPLPDGGARIGNRLYIRGPLERLYAAVLGRRMRASVQQFVRSEKALAESEA